MSDLEALISDFFEEMRVVIQQVQGTYLEDDFRHKLEVLVRILRDI